MVDLSISAIKWVMVYACYGCWDFVLLDRIEIAWKPAGKYDKKQFFLWWVERIVNVVWEF